MCRTFLYLILLTSVAGDNFRGFVQIYDRPGTPNPEGVIRTPQFIIISDPTAHDPVPADGELLMSTWANLSWSPGDFAVLHHVYIGDNPDGMSRVRSQSGTSFLVGFPGFPYPDGLVPGTTYYWRIDEAQANGNVFAGDVWSFMVPPRTAYNPVPADGAKFVDPDEDLSWASGFGAKLHLVYFGDNFDYVANAAGGLPRGDTNFYPGQLEQGKTYYWRIDEFDSINTYKGDVWRFTTAGEGGGVRGKYYQGMNFENFVLTRIEPQIDFNWGDGEPDPVVGPDNFSARWTGEVEAAFTETYTFYTNSDDGVRLWIDGQRLVNNWTDHGNTEDKGTIYLVAGSTYSLVMEMYENGGDAVAELRWSSPSTPKQLIPQAALSPPVKAGNPKPGNGAVDVKHNLILSWSPGEDAALHQIYFGTDADAVKDADENSWPEHKGTWERGSETYEFEMLEWNITYYWRVDEIEDDGTLQKGNVWSFTTANFFIVDDFESYNDLEHDDPASNRIFDAWIDGFDNPAVNGSIVGYEIPPFAEQTIVHGGFQSMPFFYDNTVGKSEATLTLTYPRDWTENGVDRLAIWYIGDPANARAPMYVVLNGSTVVQHDDPDAAKETAWTRWNIDLQAFADQGVNLANVNSITLGLGNRNYPIPGGSGKLYFDDIRLHRPYWPIIPWPIPEFPDRPDWPIFPGFPDFPDY